MQAGAASRSLWTPFWSTLDRRWAVLLAYGSLDVGALLIFGLQLGRLDASHH